MSQATEKSTSILKHIPLADLNACHQRIRPLLDDAWARVMDRSSFIYGEEVHAFEQEIAEYLGVKHAISCASGTDALIGAIKALELPPNSEIIVPDFTFIAPAEAVLQAGFRAVFIDIDPDTFTIDPQLLERHISPKTRAIIAVHLNGQCADMESIMKVAQKHNLSVIEDAAQGIGSEYHYTDGTTKKAGGLAHLSATSFFPSKNLGTIGDGGAVFTNNEALTKRVRTFFAHGKSGPNYKEVGINSRLDGIQAAVLRVKLKELDGFTKRRQQSANRYDVAFAGLNIIQTPTKASYSTHTYHKYSILVKGGHRDRLQAFLKEKNIASKVYYAFPCHAEPPYSHLPFYFDNTENSTSIGKEILSLPMHSELSVADQDRVIFAVQEFDRSIA